MERRSIIVISIIIVAVIAALFIQYYQSTSTKVVAAQCERTWTQSVERELISLLTLTETLKKCDFV